MANERVIHIGTELDTSGMLSGITQMRQMLGSLSVDSNLFKDVNKDLDKLSNLTISINSALKNGVPEKELKGLLKNLSDVTKISNSLPDKIRQVSIETKNIQFPKEALNRLDEIEIEIEKLDKAAKDALGEDLRKNLRNAIPTDIISNKTLDKILSAKNVTGALEDELLKVRNAAQVADTSIEKMVSRLAGSNSEQVQAAGKLLEESYNKGTLDRDRDSLLSIAGGVLNKSDFNDLVTAVDNYNTARAKTITLENNYAQIMGIISNSQLSAEQKAQQIVELRAESQSIVNSMLQEQVAIQRETANVAQQTGESIVKGANEVATETEKANEHLRRQDSLLKQIASRATSLIGIGAVFNYITRGIREAWNGIKELDKEFTQIAVVTDKTTTQLWQSFSTYSQMAQALGVTTKDAVATSALYYQQGLDTAEVMTLTAETIKMAQIAGMDFATATNQMTAALRGFNLEMSDASKVNDIFSTLAAGAAVDTQELAYALTKTASIAESAGMSIDTTSAFLTKMIETTREAPENIGTAMKSIIARFEELKSNPLALTVEVDGEEVVANKVEKAIALAGVRLRDETTGQFRDLDDVFIELAKSWDGLDRNTQRYIATIAAGSRQQSRFIALMDGYDRTLELVEMAQDSEGQSAAQFLKTLDSLDSKLNQISNSLESLYQKFVNSEFFGGLLDGLNNLLQGLSDFDAGQLANFAMIGTVIINTIINSFKNGLPAFTQIANLAGSQIGSSIQAKIQENLEGKKINNIIQKFTVAGAMQRVDKGLNIKGDKEKNALKQIAKEKQITIKANITDAQLKIDELDNKLKTLGFEKEQAQYDISITGSDDAKEDLNKINDQITDFTQQREVARQSLNEFVNENENIDKQLTEQFREIDEQIGKESVAIGQIVQQNLGAAMSAAGTSSALALATAVTTAFSSGDAWQVLSSGLGTLGISLLPQLTSVLVNTAASVVPVALAEGKGIGAALGAGINAGLAAAGPALVIAAIGALVIGLVALITQAVGSLKSDTQRLDEELKNLQNKQKQLEEISERAQAEYAIENTRTKQLDKLIAKYDKLIEKVNRTTAENEELIKVQNDLGQDFPDLLKYYDAAGNAVLKQREDWQEIIKLQKESQQLLLGKAFSSELDVKINELSIAEKTKERKQLDTRQLLNNNLFADLDKNNATSLDVISVLTKNQDNQQAFLSSLYQGNDSTISKVIGNIFTSGNGPDEKEFQSFLENIQTLDAQEQSQRLEEYMTNILGTGALLDEYLSGVGSNLTEFVVDLKNLDIFKDEDNVYDKNIENKIKEIEEFIYNGVVKYTDTLLPSDDVFSNDLKSRVASGLANKKQINYLRDIETPETGTQLQKILAIAEEKGLDTVVLKSLANQYTDDTKIDYSKDTQLNEEVQSIIAQIRQAYLQELGELEVETLNSLKEGLNEEDFDIINNGNFENLSREKIKELKEQINNLGLDTTFIDNVLTDFDKKIANWSAPFKSFAENFGTGLTEALIDNDISGQVLSIMENNLQGLKDVPKVINGILSVDDWGNIDQLKSLSQIFYDAGNSAGEAAEKVLRFANVLGGAVSLKIDSDTFGGYFVELGKKIQDTAKEYKDLYSAMEEYNELGSLSAQTITDLVAAGKAEYLVLDENTNALKLDTQAIEENWHAEMEAATATLDMEIARQEAAQAGLKIQLEVEKRKLEILRNAKNKKGVITAAEYNELRKLDEAYSVDIINNQINLNTESLIQDGTFFTDLLESREKGYGQLVQQAVHYGKQIQEALISGVATGGTFTPAIDLSNAWAEQEKENRKASAKARAMPDSSAPYYHYDSTELDNLIAQEDELVKALEGEINNRDEVLKQLTDTRNKIKNITTNSTFVDYMKDTGKATKDANKKLKDYISTLEKYYNLDKKVETLSKETQKTKKKWEKTGSAEDEQNYRNALQNEANARATQKAIYTKERDNDLSDLQKSLASYNINAEDIRLDENGFLDQDHLWSILDRMSKNGSLNAETGEEVEKIIKEKLSEIENDTKIIQDTDDWFTEQYEELESQKQKLEEIKQSIDRLANVKQALQSISEQLEQATEENQQYYESGGREGINGIQYVRAEAQNIEAQGVAREEYQRGQTLDFKELQKLGYEKFFHFNEGDQKFYQNDIAVSEINGEEEKKLYEQIKKLADGYNELTDSINDSTKAQQESAKRIREFQKTLRKTYSDMVNRLAEDMAKLDQKEIDEVKKKYAMIQEEDDKYLEALQKSIDKQRQLRDQAKSYDDLEKDEKRLALLERDTSGANAAEIAALKEQIKDARQNLVDTEQDNIVNNIAEDNKTRKDKMDEETQFLQNVMDERTYDMQYYIDKAQDIVNAAIDGDAGAYQRMLDIMQEAEESFFRTTAEDQQAWLEELQSTFKQSEDWRNSVLTGLGELATSTRSEIINSANELNKTMDGISTYSDNIKIIEDELKLIDLDTSYINAQKEIENTINWLKELEKQAAEGDYDIQGTITYTATFDGDGSANTIKSSEKSSKLPEVTSENKGNYAIVYDSSANGGKGKDIGLIDKNSTAYRNKDKTQSGSPLEFLDINDEDDIKRANSLKVEKWGSSSSNLTTNLSEPPKNTSSNGNTSLEIDPNKYYTVDTNGNILSEDTKPIIPDVSRGLKKVLSGEELIELMKNSNLTFYKAYAKGGLVDYTGPAWVDGTKTAPEAFLTAEDTRNIQSLTEVLQTILSPSAPVQAEKTEQKAGDTNIEIHIEVEQMSSDYDVEEMLDTIQARISEASEGQVTIVR